MFVSMEPDEFGFSWIKSKTHRGTPDLNFAYTGDKFILCLKYVSRGKMYVELSVVCIKMDQDAM